MACNAFGERMKSRNVFLVKIIIGAAVFILMPWLASCGMSEGGETGTIVSFGKDGTVRSHIEESFGESYYDKEELQQTVSDQAASYNKLAGEERITVERVEVLDDMAQVDMTYTQAADYAFFNKVIFFAGSAGEAHEQGYDLNVVLSGAENSQETVGQSDILAMEGVTLLITDIGDSIALNGKALYISENVTVSSNGKTVCRVQDSGKPAYIIYK